MNLLAVYQAQITADKISADPQQIEVIRKLNALKSQIEQPRSFLSKILSIFSKPTTAHKQGIYLYSGVGRGKTMLMDIFYNNLQVGKNKKYRIHFHLFMKAIHAQMQQTVGIKDPIDYIVKNNYQSYTVICLDEFLVHDIADAMILARVIDALFKYNIKLVTTSNLHPDLLYKNGLQRELFLPAITALKQNLQVLNLAGDLDYRAKMLLETSCFFGPDKQHADLQEIFTKLSNADLKQVQPACKNIEIADRTISVVAAADNIVWFDFNVICNSPRSQHDYIEIAEIYKIVLLDNLTKLDDSKNDIARRFINFIDILYDYNVKLIISSEVALVNIYVGNGLAFEFARTTSRLKEMQTERYLSKIHL